MFAVTHSERAVYGRVGAVMSRRVRLTAASGLSSARACAPRVCLRRISTSFSFRYLTRHLQELHYMCTRRRLDCIAIPLPAHRRAQPHIGFGRKVWTERRRTKRRWEIIPCADSDYSRVPRVPQRTARHHLVHDSGVSVDRRRARARLPLELLARLVGVDVNPTEDQILDLLEVVVVCAIALKVLNRAKQFTAAPRPYRSYWKVPAPLQR